MKKILFCVAMVAMFFVSCNKNGVTPQNTDEQEDPATDFNGITIDGDFSDWEALTRSKCVYAINDPNSPWDAVDEIRVYADDDNIYYYILFNRDVIADYLAENDKLPCRLNLNTDGEFTSGYSYYFLQSYDFMIEGYLGDGNGGWGFYDGDLHQRIDGWQKLLEKKSGLTDGAGSGVEYEISLDRKEFNAAASKSPVPMPIKDVIQTSIRFYETVTNPDWAELSNMPNEDGGYGNLLEVKL